jgi:hypothetical protein
MGYIKEGEERGGSPFYQTKYDSVIGLLRCVHPAEILAAQPSARKKCIRQKHIWPIFVDYFNTMP